MRHRPRFRLPYIAPFDDDVQHTLATMPLMTTLLRVMPVTDMLVTTVQTMVVMIVPMMEMGAGCHAIRLGDPLRGRAFRSNLRFAPISTAIPVASARKLAARSACRRADTPCRSPGHGARQPPRPARADAARRARRGLRLARPGRLRRAPGCAPRPALVPAQVRTLVRTLPSSPSAACFARLPAAPSAPTATHSPWRLPSAGFPGADFPIAHTAGSAVLTARGGLGFHTRRIPDAHRAMAGHVCDRLANPLIYGGKERPGVPEKVATDRCSLAPPVCAPLAALWRPCRIEHLSGHPRTMAQSMRYPAEHLSVLACAAPYDDNARPERPGPGERLRLTGPRSRRSCRPNGPRPTKKTGATSSRS